MGQLFEDLSFNVNYFEGINALGGTLYIYDDIAVFRPHSLNLGSSADRFIQIRNISGYKKGLLTILYIYLNNGEYIKLATWKKNTIIDALEKRKKVLLGTYR